jgi:transposase
MAFLKQDKKEAGTYLRLVRSYRDEYGHSRHDTICSMGKVEDYSEAELKSIGQTLYELGGGTIEELKRKLLHEEARFYYGFPLVVRKLMERYSLSDFFDRITRNSGLGFSLTECLTLLISERLHDPVSKFSSYKNQSDYVGIQDLALHQIYRSLDQLYDNQEQIKTIIYSKGRNLFNQKLDLVFYDVTTFYFDSDNEDGFREKGFGKDGKIGNTIIVFGLLIDKDKQPVGYEVYHGRQYEGHTFPDAVARLKKKYQIEKIVCVADTGMMNKDNLSEITESEYEYIIGERLKNISEKKQEEILDIKKYSHLELECDTTHEKISIQFYQTEYKGKKLITTFSTVRAKKDKAEREEKIAKALDLIANPAKLEKKAKNHYLKKDGESAWSLDMEKIKRAEKYDGFLCIATNNENLPVEKIIDAYKHLYKIEHCFRSFKTFLETRPMFHWTEKRILGHLSLCYISFTMLNHLQLLLKKRACPQSENQIRHNLIKMQMSLVMQNENEYYLRSKTEEGAKQIMKALSIRELPDLFPRKSLNLYV